MTEILRFNCKIRKNINKQTVVTIPKAYSDGVHADQPVTVAILRREDPQAQLKNEGTDDKKE